MRKELIPILDELQARDPVLERLIMHHGPPALPKAAPRAERFSYLIRSIVYQQLAGSAAQAIHNRVVAAFDGALTPEGILGTSPELLRSCGLSAAKTTSVRDLAERVELGKLTLDRVERLSDEEVVARLVEVRGIGRWTAEMFLLFCLGRLDIWPVGDFGVRVGYASAWELPELPTLKSFASHGDVYRPYRSVVAWYCWRAADVRKLKN